MKLLNRDRWATVVSIECRGCSLPVEPKFWDQDFYLCVGCVYELAKQVREWVRVQELANRAALLRIDPHQPRLQLTK